MSSLYLSFTFYVQHIWTFYAILMFYYYHCCFITVELPHSHVVMEDRSCPGVWLYHCDETSRADSTHSSLYSSSRQGGG